MAEGFFHRPPNCPRYFVHFSASESADHKAPGAQLRGLLHVGPLGITDPVLLDSVGVGILGLEDNAAAALDGALVVRLRFLLKAADEPQMLQAFDDIERLRRLVDLGITLLAVIGERAVKHRFEQLTLCPVLPSLLLFLLVRSGERRELAH